jgi:hypothetical protein
MDEQAPHLISTLISEVGLPVALLLGSVGCIYFLIKYVLGQIVRTINKTQDETKQEINMLNSNFDKSHENLYSIHVQLIKRIHRMENTLIRTNTECRMHYGMEIDKNSIGQVEDDEG